jgi:O-Antigen ligase
MQLTAPAKLSGGVALGAGAIALGYIATTKHGAALLIALLLGAAFVALAARSRAVTVSVLLLAVVNGIPLLDLESFVAPGSFRPNDLFVMILLACLALWNVQNPVRPTPRYVVLARWWAGVFLLWWLFTLVRSSFYDTVPVLQASLFGRDFLYFGLLVPAFVGVAWRRDELLLIARVLGVATVIFALAATLDSLGVGAVSVISHPHLTANFEGLTRIYAPMNDLVVLGFAVGVGVALLSTDGRQQRLGWGLTILFGIAFALQLTRIAYIAALIAIAVTICLWGYQRDAVANRMRPRVLALVACLVLLVGAFTFIGSAGAGPVGAVVGRATSGLSEAQTRTANVGYRLDLAGRMEEVLGSSWAFGLGFWHPQYHYVPDLPDGSIRNADLGVSNSVMTMGVTGTVLLYLPLLFGVVALQRARTRRPLARGEGWAVYGLSTWLLIAVVASATMSTLFTVNGVVLSAAVVALGLRLTVPESSSTARTP